MPATPVTAQPDHIRTHWIAGYPLRVMVGHQQPDRGLHTHDFTELVLVQSGRGTHRTARDAQPVSAGAVFVVPPGSAHGYQATQALVITNVLFDRAALGLPLHELRELPGHQALFAAEPDLRGQGGDGRLRLTRGALAEAVTLAGGIAAAHDARPPGWRFAARTRLMELLLHLAAAVTAGDRRRDDAVVRLAGVLARMERDCTAPWTLPQLAAEAGLRVNHFLRCFRRATGSAPIAHLIQLRVALAMELLRAGAPDITSVALRCGFNDPNYFTRQFRRVAGVSPSRWRTRHAPRP